MAVLCFFHCCLKDTLFNSQWVASASFQQSCDLGSQGVGSVVRTACRILKGGRCSMKGGNCSRPDLGCCSTFLLKQQQLRFSPTYGDKYFTSSHINKAMENFLWDTTTRNATMNLQTFWTIVLLPTLHSENRGILQWVHNVPYGSCADLL